MPQPLPLSPAARRQTKAGPADAKLEIPLLIFWIDHQAYALSIAITERLLRRADLTLIPPRADAPAWDCGSFALETDDPIQVFSLRAFWNLPAQTGAEANAQALIVLRFENARVALLVDSCQSVIASLSQPAPFKLPDRVKTPRSACLESIVRWQEALLLIINIRDLMTALLPRSNETPSTAQP